ncbi:hypothetical protein FF38_00815 [Lucilia cuprina]|uniref:Uncharacterized protein n=1 Tax=Lucilia cuprina TaxID=7375 RepID=A0A0L0CDY8_LUCCU|nr:hypothetical protein FF38_00815 [Lucilia cuprina]
MDIEKPTCSKRKPIEDTAKNKYKIWKTDPSSMVPGRTRDRWCRNYKTVSSEINKVEDTIENVYEESTSITPENTHIILNNPSDEYESDENEYESDGNDYGSDEVYIGSSDSEHSILSDEECSDHDINHKHDEEGIDISGMCDKNYLYESCRITVNEAVVNTLDMFMKHKFSKSALKDQLKLINRMLPNGHKMPNTLYQFFKYIEDRAPPCTTIKHFFCKNCHINLPKGECVCKYCKDTNNSYFYEIDIIEQLIRLFEVDRIGDKLMNTSSNGSSISDICDGSEYRRVNNNRKKYDLTLVIYTDGISLIKSSMKHHSCWNLVRQEDETTNEPIPDAIL